MAMEFYSDTITARSREVLQRLAGELDFVLIGGWAVNFYVGAQKSTDVDIVIRADKLEHFKTYGVQKYEGLPIYFAIVEGVCVDLMVEGISDSALTLPLSRVLAEHVVINGVKTVTKPVLLLLKMCGYFSFDRQKIEKDIIDVASLLFYSGVNLADAASLVKKYRIDERKAFIGMLEYIDKGRNLWQFVAESLEEYNRLASAAKKAIKAQQRAIG